MASSCGQLSVPRERWEELVAFDDPALGSISKIMALWNRPFVPEEEATATILTQLRIGFHSLLVLPKQSLQVEVPFLLVPVNLTRLHKN